MTRTTSPAPAREATGWRPWVGAIQPDEAPAADSAWHILLHLDEGPRGAGLATHAILHAHVWPGHDLIPTVRVPLPALLPADALDWIVAAAGAAEPAPHPR